MSVFFSSLVLVLTLVIVYSYCFFKKAHQYFNDKRFPTLEPTFMLGNLGDAILLKKPLALTIYNLYLRLEPYKYAGLYWLHRPFVMLRDPEIIKSVLVKDFHHFKDRGIHDDENEEPLNNNLLRMSGGDTWKVLRTKLTPLFTIGKLKMIIAPIRECGKKFSPMLDQTNGEPFEMKELAERFAMDVIGSCAFGMNTLAMEDPRSIFLIMGKQIFKFRYQTIIRHFFPNLSKFWLKIFNLRYIDKEVENFFSMVIKKAIKLREDHPKAGTDMLDTLLAIRNVSVDSNENNENLKNDTAITTELIIAQCYLLFAAGFETTSSSFAYLMLELSSNQSIQNKVREEITRALEKTNGQITSGSLKQMTYCDMVIAEALRLHPPAGILLRQCTKTYQIPSSEAIIPQGTSIFMSIYGLHRDSKYYEKPNEFYPEHFTQEAKNKRPKCSYMPFGGGPRICIGDRLAKWEIKIGMICVLKEYVFEISPRMKFPLEHNFEMSVGLMPAKEIWLQCNKIQSKA